MKITACRKILISALIIGWGTGCSADEKSCNESPCEPESALHTFEIVEDFQIELFAAEPLISDPVAMEVDEKGRVYVVEDPGYPENREGMGVVRLLSDTNGDGKPDQSTVFADRLRSPRGIIRWKDGVLVTDAPDIIYMEDTNRDGEADIQKVLMSGFGYGNPQLGINAPIYGIDNWIYLAQRVGDSTPYFVDKPDDKQVVGGRNIRFRPDTGEWEPRSTYSQFGQSFDAFGRHLLILHNNHISQEAIDSHYLARNPDLIFTDGRANISDHGGDAAVFPITENVRHELFTDQGTFTAACGITCYLGGIFPSEFHGVSFVAEPAHNLVHVDILEEDGPQLVARRMFEEHEFLASTDRWFRPVNFYTGPDGALYVIDYYREVIEQPRFLSEKVLESGILYDGSNRGRIYRITPDNTESASWTGQLDIGLSTTDELVRFLEHKNIWWRRTAQRLLVDRRDRSASTALKQLVESANNAPEVRVHALWTLDGLGVLAANHIESALNDESPRVREHGIRLAELYLDEYPDLVRFLMKLSDDADLRVQYQLLNTLGDLVTEEAQKIRQQIFYNNIEDEWMQVAAFSARGLDYQQMYEEALAKFTRQESEGLITYFQRLGILTGVQKNPEKIHFLVQSIVSSDDDEDVWWQAASLNGLAQGLQRSSDQDETLELIRGSIASLSLHPQTSSLRESAQNVLAVTGVPSGRSGQQIFQEAEQIASDRAADSELRADAINILNLAGSELYEELLTELIQPQEPGQVQAAAIRALGSTEGAELGELLLSRWNRMTSQVREAAMEALLADDERIQLVLDAVEEGKIQHTAVSLMQTRRLMLHSNDELRLRAQSLLGLTEEPRSDVVDRYQEAVARQGNTDRGRVVYDRACAMCHQIDGEGGIPFGPDLANVRNRSPEALLVDILMPNAEITVGFEQWRVERHSGEVVQGAITSESPGSITFRDPAGRETTVPRNDIRNMEALDSSPMPEGLEQQISIEEMADLLEYLRNH